MNASLAPVGPAALVSRPRVRPQRRSAARAVLGGSSDEFVATSKRSGDDDGDTPMAPFRAPPNLCSSAASEARNVLRVLREGAVAGDPTTPRRVRVELPLPPADIRTDEMRYLGLHGQAADWSGGMQQRLRVTRTYVEENMLDGYQWEYLGLLDRDADGMAVWTCGENMTVVTHPSDVTMKFFLDLVDGDYGERVARDDHVLVVVNAFWTGAGEKVGQPWEFGLKARAKEVLAPATGDWEKAYVARRVRSAAGTEGAFIFGYFWLFLVIFGNLRMRNLTDDVFCFTGTLRRAWPGKWQLFDAEGVRVIGEWHARRDGEPSNREIAETLNEAAGATEAAGFNRSSSDTSRDTDVIT